MLLRVPRPEFAEAPSSWLSQVALSQAVAPLELFDFLELKPTVDPDFTFVNLSRLRQIARTCNLPEGAFGTMRHMFKSLQVVDKKGEVFLLSQSGFPRYRFCPACLRSQRRPHYPLHWRFRAYRWCPEHEELLRDRCPTCHAPVVLPANLSFAAEGGRRPQLDCCMVCGNKLTNKERPTRFSGTRNFLSAEEMRVIRNGAAMMSALLRRELFVGTRNNVQPLEHLRRIEREGHLGHRTFRYERLEKEYVDFRNPWTNSVMKTAVDPNAKLATVREGLFGMYRG
jgi:hypothetical protein